MHNAFGCFSGKAQIAESKHRLRRLLDEADDAVTMVRLLDANTKYVDSL